MSIKNDLSKYLDSTKFQRKLERLKEENNKYVAREAADNWRKHVPVYGWTKINYPTGIQYPLVEKYKDEKRKKEKAEEEENQRIKIAKEEAEKQRIKEEEEKEKKEKDLLEHKINEDEKPKTEVKKEEEKKRTATKFTNWIDPEKCNSDALEKVENLIKEDYSSHFLQNYKKTDFDFLKKQFMKYDTEKKKYTIDCNVPANYAKLITEGTNNFLYELGFKQAETYLTTLDYEKKCKFVDLKMMYDKKYCTMYPKHTMLGPKPDPNYEKNLKQVTDISFDDDYKEKEKIIDLARLPPENITEEWIKENLRPSVEKINFENCYWLSKDLISKLGRLDNQLISVSLRNMDLTNYIVENILNYATNVEELDISNCTGLTNGILEILSDQGKNLKYINLFGLNDCVNDGGLINLGGKCSKLNSINLGRCKEITDLGIKGLICNNIKFEKIVLAYNYKLTDEAIGWILEYSKDTLLEFTMNFMPKITENALEGLKKCSKLSKCEMVGIKYQADFADILSLLSNLKEINLSGCAKITDDKAIGLQISNPNLKILRLNNCPLTDAFLTKLMEIKTSILLLSINRTPKIKDKTIKDLEEKKKPNLRIIRATNLVWDKKNYGVLCPWPSDNYKKPDVKGAKKAAAKKNDDKSPENQLKALMEEMKPKMICEYYAPEPKKKGKGKKKK